MLINQGEVGDFKIDENSVMSILEDRHHGKLSIHPGATKMYTDLKKTFWWPGMKKEII